MKLDFFFFLTLEILFLINLHISCFCFVTSYLEIYNERVQDLLRDRTTALEGVLKVREHPVDGPYVESKKSCAPHAMTMCTKW